MKLFTLSASMEMSCDRAFFRFLEALKGTSGTSAQPSLAQPPGIPSGVFTTPEMWRILEDAMGYSVTGAVPFCQASLLRQPEEVYDQQASAVFGLCSLEIYVYVHIHIHT